MIREKKTKMGTNLRTMNFTIKNHIHKHLQKGIYLNRQKNQTQDNFQRALKKIKTNKILENNKLKKNNYNKKIKMNR